MAEKRKYERFAVKIRKRDLKKLRAIIKKGTAKAQRIQRAQILNQLEKGRSAVEIAEILDTTAQTVYRTGSRYEEKGLEYALHGEPRPGAQPILDEHREAQIIAMVCSASPAGTARWTLSLIAEEAIKRGVVDKISGEAIRLMLHRHELKPWREKNVVHRRADTGIRKKDGGRTSDV